MSAYNQTQCPNCGGFRVNASRTTILGQGTPKPLSQGWRIANRLLMFTVLAVIGAIGSFILEFFIFGGRTFGISVPLAGILGIVFAALAVKADNGRMFTTVIEGYFYKCSCDLCGYRWTWDSRTPKPPVRVDPALIAKGEQKLREQEGQQRLIELDALRRRVIEDEQRNSE